MILGGILLFLALVSLSIVPGRALKFLLAIGFGIAGIALLLGYVAVW
jgi:hypothetical protein